MNAQNIPKIMYLLKEKYSGSKIVPYSHIRAKTTLGDQYAVIQVMTLWVVMLYSDSLLWTPIISY